MVSVSGFDDPPSAPSTVQDVNTYPLAGVAVKLSSVPTGYSVPSLPPEIVPLPAVVSDKVAAGATSAYVNASAAVVALLPAAVVTVTSTTPVPGGDVAVHAVAVQEFAVPGTPPKRTEPPPRFVPVTV